MKKRITLPIVVEGKYDKITLTSLFDCTVLTTDGFGIFNSKEKQLLIRRIAKDGIILLTDSDGGGVQIRSFLRSILGGEKVHNLFVPKIEGKERRKSKPSAAGTLGVEGMSREVIERVLLPFTEGEKLHTGTGVSVTKLDFFEDGLSGGKDSAAKRAELCALMDLPSDMTANALLEAINLLYPKEEYLRLVERISKDG
jgi:ribonuclease M5